MVRRLAIDPRYSAIRPILIDIQAKQNAGDWFGARELAIDVFNAVWGRSQEYEVARDAFIRRIEGRGFNTTRYHDPLTSDRGAALAWIMQADKTALDAINRESTKPNELVIELTGEFGVIRLMKD